MPAPHTIRGLTGPIARPGPAISAVLGAAAAALALLGATLIGGLVLLVAGANLAFFRNPARALPPGDDVAVSPADGRVVEVVEIDDPDGFVGPARRIAIFLSVLNVHVNRVPLAGKVRAVRRSGARFLAAFNPRASELNVQVRIDLEAASGVRVGCSQITGLIARRVICNAREGDELERGQLYGLICYGSRAEIYVPRNSRVLVRPGDRVRGGSTALAEVRA